MATNSFTNVFRTFPQLFITLIVSINSFSCGMHFGWTAPVLPILRARENFIEITQTDETWLECMYMIGSIITLPISVYLMDKIGRKYCMITSSIISLISWTVIGFAEQIEYLYLGRILSGMSANLLWLTGPAYISEIANKGHRGFLITLYVIMNQFGILAIYSLAPFTAYYVPSVLGVTMLVLQLIGFLVVPKSPYHLLSKKKVSEAKAVLRTLRKEYQENEFEDIVKAIEKQNQSKGCFRNLIFVKSNRKAAFICILLSGCQCWSGYSVVVMNVHTILQKAESTSIKPEITSIIFGSFMLVALIISSLNIDSRGRKLLMMVSQALSGFFLLIISIYFILKAANTDLEKFSYLPAIAAVGYAVFVKLGVGYLPRVLSAELFAQDVKAIGMALDQASYHLSSLTSLYFYHHFLSVGKIEVPLFLFAVVAFTSMFYTIFLLPETKRKTLEEIQVVLAE